MGETWRYVKGERKGGGGGGKRDREGTAAVWRQQERGGAGAGARGLWGQMKYRDSLAERDRPQGEEGVHSTSCSTWFALGLSSAACPCCVPARLHQTQRKQHFSPRRARSFPRVIASGSEFSRGTRGQQRASTAAASSSSKHAFRCHTPCSPASDWSLI